MNSMTETLITTLDSVKESQNKKVEEAILVAVESAIKTPEIIVFQKQLEDMAQQSYIEAVSDYLNNFIDRWNDVRDLTDACERNIAASNLAMVKMIPGYEKNDLPYGCKTVLKSLTKTAAKELLQTENIRFDPQKRNFYHKTCPRKKLTADEITVAKSSLELFAEIPLDDLISLESQLYEDTTFAMEHPTGKRIFDIIKGWNNFISFDIDTYYHARKIEDGQRLFLDQEMLKAPENVSSHGRYNAIGKSCYYIAETKEGALSEVLKHSRGQRYSVQLAGLRPVKSAKIIDLSEDTKEVNRFVEHLRFTVENETGKVVKSYLLPNFVASCCKKVGIEGIKYKSTKCKCFVLWKDDYFEFVKGSREIIQQK